MSDERPNFEGKKAFTANQRYKIMRWLDESREVIRKDGLSTRDTASRFNSQDHGFKVNRSDIWRLAKQLDPPIEWTTRTADRVSKKRDRRTTTYLVEQIDELKAIVVTLSGIAKRQSALLEAITSELGIKIEPPAEATSCQQS